jgi:hypothetical protein
MSYRALDLECACGEAPSRIDEVGFTSAHELVLHWWCPRCERVVSVARALTDCWNDCPRPEVPQPVMQSQRDYGAEDRLFLQSLGVRPE